MIDSRDFCTTTNVNSGLAACDIAIGKPIALLYSPQRVVIPDSEANGDLQSWIVSQLSNLDKGVRLYPFTDIKQLDEISTEPTNATLNGYGYQVKVADGSIGYTFNFPTSVCRLKQLAQFDNLLGYMFILDDKLRLYGQRIVSTALQAGGIAGFKIDSMSFSANSGLLGDGANVKSAKLSVNFGSDIQFVKSLDVINTELDITALVGIQNVRIERQYTTSFTYKVLANCGGKNLYDLYKTELSVVGAWLIVDMTTNTAITPVSITANDTDKSFTIVISQQPPATYSYSISLADIDDLEAAGIVGFEQSSPLFDKNA